MNMTQLMSKAKQTSGGGKGWYYDAKSKLFMATVDARGACSARLFDANGRSIGKVYPGKGTSAYHFAEAIASSVRLSVKEQPNLETDCKTALPSALLVELNEQVQALKGAK